MDMEFYNSDRKVTLVLRTLWATLMGAGIHLALGLQEPQQLCMHSNILNTNTSSCRKERHLHVLLVPALHTIASLCDRPGEWVKNERTEKIQTGIEYYSVVKNKTHSRRETG